MIYTSEIIQVAIANVYYCIFLCSITKVERQEEKFRPHILKIIILKKFQSTTLFSSKFDQFIIFLTNEKHNRESKIIIINKNDIACKNDIDCKLGLQKWNKIEFSRKIKLIWVVTTRLFGSSSLLLFFWCGKQRHFFFCTYT